LPAFLGWHFSWKKPWQWLSLNFFSVECGHPEALRTSAARGTFMTAFRQWMILSLRLKNGALE
jgi:hypothetical protein